MFDILLPAIVAGTDAMVKKHREENDVTYRYLNDSVKVVTFHNKGAFLGKGSSYPVIVSAASIFLTVILGIVFVLTLTKSGLKLLKFGLGLLLGGAFSNSYDRLKKGYVVDYLIFEKAPGFLKNMVFNISDFAIIIGSLISVLQ